MHFSCGAVVSCRILKSQPDKSLPRACDHKDTNADQYEVTPSLSRSDLSPPKQSSTAATSVSGAWDPQHILETCSQTGAGENHDIELEDVNSYPNAHPGKPPVRVRDHGLMKPGEKHHLESAETRSRDHHLECN